MKKNDKPSISYDVESIPIGMSLHEVFKIFKETGMMLYTSVSGDGHNTHRPKRISINNADSLNVIDVNGIIESATLELDVW